MATTKRTALLVTDVQHGAFDGERCPAIHRASLLLANTARLLDTARRSGMRVVYIQHDAEAGEVLEKGTPQWRIHPHVRPSNADPIVNKREPNAFNGTPLHVLLQSLRVHSLVVCGLQSEQCVGSTVLAALALDYAVTVASDAHSTWPNGEETAEQIIEGENKRLAGAGARVIPTSQLIKLFEP